MKKLTMEEVTNASTSDCIMPSLDDEQEVLEADGDKKAGEFEKVANDFVEVKQIHVYFILKICSLIIDYSAYSPYFYGTGFLNWL